MEVSRAYAEEQDYKVGAMFKMCLFVGYPKETMGGLVYNLRWYQSVCIS